MDAIPLKYDPPRGKPLGTNGYYRFGAAVLRGALNLVAARRWLGVDNIPQNGPAIVVCNHLSYVDPLLFAHYLYNNGRAPRFLGKASVFRIPIVGRIIAGSGQIPVERESENAARALDHAIAMLEAGHLLGVYPEGTLTRDPHYWPMEGKTGIARLAIMTKVPVIPCAQWGAEKILPPYSKRLKIFPRTPVTVIAGPALDFSRWYGKSEDPQALTEATSYVMDEITKLLASIRQESPPATRFNPHTSQLPRTGNFKKTRARSKAIKDAT